MGNVIFGVDIAGIIADVIGPAVFPVTIERETKGARAPGNLTGGPTNAGPQTFTCQGFWEDFTGQPPPGVTLELNDRKAVLIGDTMPPGFALVKNDAITVLEASGPVGPLYFVKLLSRDPAAAVFTCLCRDRRGLDGV